MKKDYLVSMMEGEGSEIYHGITEDVQIRFPTD